MLHITNFIALYVMYHLYDAPLCKKIFEFCYMKSLVPMFLDILSTFYIDFVNIQVLPIQSCQSLYI